MPRISRTDSFPPLEGTDTVLIYEMGLSMKNIFRAFALFLAIMAPAKAFSAAEVKPAGQEDIVRAESYLQSLKTLQARFVQTTHNGEQLVGTFYLSRPGKLRFEYDPPVENFVVADGVFIYFYDSLLEEQTNAPIGTTLADFFLRKEFTFGDDLTVKDAKFAGGYLQVQVVQSEEPDAGSITFAFTQEPFELKKWRVIDAQGQITEVELFYLKTGLDLERKLFVYADPKKKGGKQEFND